MKVGDLVQVLPAKIGYYIITGKHETGYGASRNEHWILAPLSGASFDHGGPMNEKFIEVVSESR